MGRDYKDWGDSRDPSRLQVTLCDLDEAVCTALAEAFQSHHNVRVISQDLVSLQTDALITASNSFGDIGGGVDRAIDLACGHRAQPAVQRVIRSEYFGELPVGSATLVSVDGRQLIVAPTMRIPGSIIGTINAYLAFRAALTLIAKRNAGGAEPIRSVVTTGLGCGVGGLPADECAVQMEAAYTSIAEGGWVHAVHPALAPFPLA